MTEMFIAQDVDPLDIAFENADILFMRQIGDAMEIALIPRILCCGRADEGTD